MLSQNVAVGTKQMKRLFLFVGALPQIFRRKLFVAFLCCFFSSVFELDVARKAAGTGCACAEVLLELRKDQRVGTMSRVFLDLAAPPEDALTA